MIAALCVSGIPTKPTCALNAAKFTASSNLFFTNKHGTCAPPLYRQNGYIDGLYMCTFSTIANSVSKHCGLIHPLETVFLSQTYALLSDSTYRQKSVDAFRCENLI